MGAIWFWLAKPLATVLLILFILFAGFVLAIAADMICGWREKRRARKRGKK